MVDFTREEVEAAIEEYAATLVEEEDEFIDDDDDEETAEPEEEVEEEVTEEVELSEVKPIAHNPEPKAEVKLHTFGNKRKRGTTDSVMSKIAKLNK